MESSQNENPPTEPVGDPAIRVLMMPRDTNVHGTIFGGVILSHIDQAGAAHARREGLDRVVTVAMDAVEFQRPVFVGDLVSLYCETIRVGRTSMSIFVDVWSRRFLPSSEHVRVTSAEIIYVNVDEDRNPLPIPARES